MMSPCLILTGKLSYVTLALDLLSTLSIPVFLVSIRVELSGLFKEISQFSVDHVGIQFSRYIHVYAIRALDVSLLCY